MLCMKYFFTFWTGIPRSEVFEFLDFQHCLIILGAAAILYFSIHAVLRQEMERIKVINRCVALLLPVLEMMRILWIYQAGETDWMKLLPLHLCGLQIFFVPLAVFTENKYIREFVFSTSLLGGVAAIIFPSGIMDTYPMIHFQTLQSIIFHMVLIFVPLVLVLGQGFQPSLARFSKSVLILVACGFAAGWVDVNFGQNYMFILEAPLNTPLVGIFNAFGHRVYLLVLLGLVIFGMYLTYLPLLVKKQIAERRRAKAAVK